MQQEQEGTYLEQMGQNNVSQATGGEEPFVVLKKIQTKL